MMIATRSDLRPPVLELAAAAVGLVLLRAAASSAMAAAVVFAIGALVEAVALPEAVVEA